MAVTVKTEAFLSKKAHKAEKDGHGRSVAVVRSLGVDTPHTESQVKSEG